MMKHKKCIDIQYLKKVINKIRGEKCELFDTGCKDSPGLCDKCDVIEAFEKELGL